MRNGKPVAFILLLLIALSNAGCDKEPIQPTQPPTQPPPPPAEKKWVVSTVAGDGTPSFINGPVQSATFHFPEDVAIDANGTIYVTDVVNKVIRKIAGGQVSTFAGSSSFDIINANGTLAAFKSPFSVALGENGNLYSTDESDPRVRKITPGADVSTYAGEAIEGFADGDADTARFYPGNHIIADAQGNVYVADTRNKRVRKISASGKVTTIADSTQITSPVGIALDLQGNLYVADRGSFLIRKITQAGLVSTVSGTGTAGDRDGSANEAQFGLDIHDLIVDRQGNLYLADKDRIRKITPQGTVSTIAGSTPGYQDGDGAIAKFNYVNGLAIDADGKIYAADLGNNRIRKISFE